MESSILHYWGKVVAGPKRTAFLGLRALRMATEERVERIVEYHGKEAESEYYREVGDDAVYDEITWENFEPLPRQG